MRELPAIDVAVLLATIGAAAAAGLALGRRATSAASFLAGERDVPWGAILLSIVATETSSVTFLSVPGKAGAGDLRFLQLPLGYCIGRIVVARLLLPGYFEGRVLTAYEVLGRRFGAGVRRASSALFLVTRTLGDGLRLYLAAIPLGLLTGWPLPGCVAAILGPTLLYTWFGGVRAVVWTDVVQFAIYVAGGVLALAVAAGDRDGGLRAIVADAHASGALRWIDLSPSLTSDATLLAGLVGGTFVALASHGTDQLLVQRYLCARGPRDAARALVASGFVVLAQFALFLLVGLALHDWFARRPGLAMPGKGDQLFAGFIVERLVEVPGAVGLLLGAVFAVSMSTLSSSLNASASALSNDFARAGAGAAAQREGAAGLRRARAATLLFALLQGAMALCGVALERSVVDVALGIASFTSGITLGLFLLARAAGPAPADERARRGDARAALLAFFGGLAVVGLLAGLTALAWPWYAAVGAVTTVAIGRSARRLARSW